MTEQLAELIREREAPSYWWSKRSRELNKKRAAARAYRARQRAAQDEQHRGTPEGLQHVMAEVRLLWGSDTPSNVIRRAGYDNPDSLVRRLWRHEEWHKWAQRIESALSFEKQFGN